MSHRAWIGIAVLLSLGITSACSDSDDDGSSSTGGGGSGGTGGTAACVAEGQSCTPPTGTDPNPCCTPEAGQSQSVQCLGAGTCTACGLTGAACGAAADAPCCKDMICNGAYGCQPY